MLQVFCLPRTSTGGNFEQEFSNLGYLLVFYYYTPLVDRYK
jgi:hypothetical protein